MMSERSKEEGGAESDENREKKGPYENGKWHCVRRISFILLGTVTK